MEAKKAVPKDDGVTKPIIPGIQATRTRKCFVGGLPVSADEQVLRTYFQQFGQVDDAVVMYDHDNKRYVHDASRSFVSHTMYAPGHAALALLHLRPRTALSAASPRATCSCCRTSKLRSSAQCQKTRCSKQLWALLLA